MCFASRIDSEHDIVMVLQMAEAHTYTLRILMLPLIEGRLTRYHHETFLSRQGTVMSNDEVYQTLENRMR